MEKFGRDGNISLRGKAISDVPDMPVDSVGFLKHDKAGMAATCRWTRDISPHRGGSRDLQFDRFSRNFGFRHQASLTIRGMNCRSIQFSLAQSKEIGRTANR